MVAIGADGSVSCVPVGEENDYGVFGQCPLGQFVAGVDAATGAVICEPGPSPTGGDVTAVSAGPGLVGGGIGGDIDLAIDPTATQARVGDDCVGDGAIEAIAEDGTVSCVSLDPDYTVFGACAPGQVVAGIDDLSGAVLCVTDSEASGDVTAVMPGTGLLGGGTGGDLVLEVDPTVVQSRLVEDCIGRGALVAIGEDGTATCATFDIDYSVFGSCGAGDVVTGFAANGHVLCAPDADSGDITGVLAGYGLDGGGTLGQVTLSVDYSVFGTCPSGEVAIGVRRHRSDRGERAPRRRDGRPGDTRGRSRGGAGSHRRGLCRRRCGRLDRR
jgi:hypothetical protein